MKEQLTPHQIGLALMEAGLAPFALDTDRFQIVWGGENYTVYVGRLPEIYIEKTVPLNYFEYRNEKWILYSAMDEVNYRLSPVVVYRGLSDDTLSFRFCLRAGSFDKFQEELGHCFSQIECALDAFGLACDMIIRNSQ